MVLATSFKNIIYSFFFLQAVISSSQNLGNMYRASVDWSKWDQLHTDNTLKRGYLSNKIFSDQEYVDKLNFNENPDFIKVIDIDGDSNLDLIYDGYYEQDLSSKVIFYLNKKDTLKEILSIDEKLIEITRRWPTGPISMKTINLNCCLENDFEVITYTHYLVNGDIDYRPIRFDIIRKDMEYAAQTFPSLLVSISKDSIPLLTGPNLSVIKYCHKDNVGYAKGSLSDKNRTIWWQVFMLEPNYKLRLGWVKREQLSRKF